MSVAARQIEPPPQDDTREGSPAEGVPPARSAHGPSIIFCFSLSWSVLIVLSGKTYLWDTGGSPFLPSPTTGLMLSIPMMIGALVASILGGSKLRVEPLGVGVTLLLLFVSDWMCRPYNFFQGPSIRGELLVGAAAAIGLFSLARLRWITPLAVLAPLLLFWCFFEEAHGRLLFSDDHPAFMYRLMLLLKNFPQIPFYNPMWNAGVDSREFFASGILNLFFLSWPLLKLFQIQEVYNLLVISVLFILGPASVYYATLHLQGERRCAAIAALLACSTSLLWYRWGLSYGAMGFVTSISLLCLTVSLVARFLDRIQILTLPQAVALIVCSTLMLFWSITAVIFLPLALYSLIALARVIRKPHQKLVIAAILALNLPWIFVFASVSNVFNYVTITHHHEHSQAPSSGHHIHEAEGDDAWDTRILKQDTHSPSFGQSLKNFRRAAGPMNPLILLFGIPGVFLLRMKSARWVWGVMSFWLLLLGGVLSPAIPQLELERMLVVVSLLWCVPSAALIHHLFASFSEGRLQGWSRFIVAPITVLVASFLLVGPFATGAVVQNRSAIRYAFASPLVDEITEAIKSHGGKGRVVFPGFILHQLSEGHIAPLALMTEKPLVASSPYHTSWRYVELIPKEYTERGLEGVEEYFSLINATGIVSHEKRWNRFFEKYPDRYELKWRRGSFRLYQRIGYASNYFFEGDGVFLSQSTNSVTLRIDSESAILKFNYFPFLESSQCELGKFSNGGGVQLVALSGCNPGETVTLRSSGTWRRVIGDLKGDR